MLVVNDLANSLWGTLGGRLDQFGVIVPVTTYAQVYSNAVITMLTTGTFAGACSGPIGAGNGPNQLITLDYSIMQGILMAGFPLANSSIVTGYCQTVANYFMSDMRINFNGTITGGPADGSYSGGGTNGLVTNIDGNILGSLVQANMGIPVAIYANGFHVALCDYIKTNATGIYQTGQVTGSANGGFFTGSGSGGHLS